MTKRIFAACAAVLVLMFTCSVPASAEEVYIFEPMPDVSFMADELFYGEGSRFAYTGQLPEGIYSVSLLFYESGADPLISDPEITFPIAAPVVVSYVFVEDPDVGDDTWVSESTVYFDVGDGIEEGPFVLQLIYADWFGGTIGGFLDDGEYVDFGEFYVRFVPAVSTGGSIDNLGAALAAAQNIMLIEFEIYGFTLTWWDVLLWSTIATVVGILIVRFLHG